MPVRYPDSLEKTLKQISVVSKHAITYGSLHFPSPRALVLSENFWRKYHCYLNCGGCCPAFTLDYLPSEIEYLTSEYPETLPHVQARAVQVMGIERPIYTIDCTKIGQEAFGKLWCRFLDLNSGGCTIHLENPLSCRIELIKFRMIGDVGHILKGPYGRAWLLQRATDGGEILCDFSDFSEEQLLNNDIPVFKQMLRWAEYFSVETFLPEVLTIVDTLYQKRDFKRVELKI